MNSIRYLSSIITMTFLLLSYAILILIPLPVSADEIRFIRSDRVERLELPFSDVVRVGNMLYLSGMLGVDPNQHVLVEGGVAAQTRQALDNIKALLEANGSDMNHVVKCTVFLTSSDDWAAMSEVYKTFFNEHLPARSAVTVKGLARNALVEIECIAILK
ncbi:MAG: Rid family detoxifying hydrolase [Gammaproteobacteria bacterium]